MAKPALDTTGRQKGTAIFTPFFPAHCQVSELLGRCNPVASDGGTQFLIPAFRGSVACKGYDPIWRPVADVVGERFDTRKPRLMEKAAQAAPHIRLGDPRHMP